MKFERMTNIEHPMYEQARALYKISFPFHEQREAFSQNKILQDEDYHFDLIYDGNDFVGLVLYWERTEDIYIEHFCVLPEMRNRQYGQKVLAKLKEKRKILMLEIDMPDDEISIRRKKFYERSGFVSNPYTHIHPPYHKNCDGHSLMIMSCPAAISKDKYEAFNVYLQNRVMRHAFEQQP